MTSTDGSPTLDYTGYSGLGNSLDDPLWFLAEAFNKIYDGDLGIDAGQYSEVVVNVWVGAGVHHFFYCEASWAEMGLPADQTVCELAALGARYPQYDHIKVYVKALDCAERYGYFTNLGKFGSTNAFYSECSNLGYGDVKPSVYVQSPHAFLNVTNFAQFENLHFTGVDQLAVQEDTCFPSLYPSAKCEFATEPTGIVEAHSLQDKL